MNGTIVRMVLARVLVAAALPAPLVISGNATTELVTGLHPNSSYSFSVAAVNAAGTSGSSDPSPIVRS